MWHKMINRKRDEWLSKSDCPVSDLISYIETTNELRDAQVEAIKTYLFLKIGCDNKSLPVLFCHGRFNNLDLDEVELSGATKSYLAQNPAAAALLEYSLLTDGLSNQVSKALEKEIKKSPESIDYCTFFRDVFYNVSYTDYLFSLPMGAGKTYLMAAFIYLDLYFAVNEPTNPTFAHNFIILAPSGLKSSVVPSLRTIQKFNPAWVIPEPSATNIRRKVLFEVLDQSKTAKKSNKTKNPNVQKIANHQPLSELFGLVAVTNAEKVILDQIKEKNGQIDLFEESDDEKDRAANELRNLIGKIPSLSIFIDEVHHAVSDEIKLRVVVDKWSENNTINSVIGFSGTPYLEKAEKYRVTDNLFVASAEISNIVYYYPLINGIGNFLKRPIVKIPDYTDSVRIIDRGVREYLDIYKDTIYDGGLAAKLGVYCGTIPKLEQTVYPLVLQIAAEYGLPSDVILRFHKGNNDFPQPVDSQLEFDTLDRSFSKKRIVLLVQIGKEGWDCRSLTGIILSQEGDCPKNMVLQTSCRCLRQVSKVLPETALIYLNESNEKKLDAQLKQQHHISLKEFSAVDNPKTLIKRYDRTEYLKLPPISFYQLKINYNTVTLELADPPSTIATATDDAEIAAHTIKTKDFTSIITERTLDYENHGNESISFSVWLYKIAKSSFGFIGMGQLLGVHDLLSDVFKIITYEKNGIRIFSPKYDHKKVEANIRKAYSDKRTFSTAEELIPSDAKLLNIHNFSFEVLTDKPNQFYPDQLDVDKIIRDDAGKLVPDDNTQQAIILLEEAGNIEIAMRLRTQSTSHYAKDRTFHYLPYMT